MKFRNLLAALACLITVVPVSAWAQDAVSGARFRWGPVAVAPRVALRDLGVDTNVFNSPTNPTRDVTAGFVPGADVYLRAWRFLVTNKNELGWTYFAKARGQRYVSANESLRIEARVNRFTPYLSGAYIRTRQRPNVDIDLRTEQRTKTGAGGVTLQVGPRLSVTAEALDLRLEFGDGQAGGSSIAEALNRHQQDRSLSLTYASSTLTTFLVRATTRRDRFLASPVRNSDSWSVVAGAELKPRAVIAGRALVGYRNFQPKNVSLPAYTGPEADVSLSYIMRARTRFLFSLVRNIDYSVTEQAPYIVGTAAGLTLNQVVAGSWYAVIRSGRGAYQYRGLVGPGAPAIPTGRTDRTASYGLGLGRRVGLEARVEIVADYVRRLSTETSRQYSGMKVGGSVSYGF